MNNDFRDTDTNAIDPNTAVTSITMNFYDMRLEIPAGTAEVWFNIAVELTSGQRVIWVQSVTPPGTGEIQDLAFGAFGGRGHGGVWQFAHFGNINADAHWMQPNANALENALVHPRAGANNFELTVSIEGGYITGSLAINGAATYTMETRAIGPTEFELFPNYIAAVTATRSDVATPFNFGWSLTAQTAGGAVLNFPAVAGAVTPATPTPANQGGTAGGGATTPVEPSKTGDASTMMLFAIGGLAIVLGVAVVLRKRVSA